MIALNEQGLLTEYRIGVGGSVTHWRPLCDFKTFLAVTAKYAGLNAADPQVSRLALRGLVNFDHPIAFRVQRTAAND